MLNVERELNHEGTAAFEKHRLGVIYRQSDHVSSDSFITVKWYCDAADPGVNGSQQLLNRIYPDVERFAQDYPQDFGCMKI